MPLYEYHCLQCDFTFEVLASLSEASKKKPCPECGKRAPRVASAFAIASGGNGRHDDKKVPGVQQPRDPRPLCMRYPQVPLSCHMDEPSLRRFVAHAQGRGNEYDDKMAMREESHKKRGEPLPKKDSSGDHAQGAHTHSHNYRRHPHTHGHSHARDKPRGHGQAEHHRH